MKYNSYPIENSLGKIKGLQVQYNVPKEERNKRASGLPGKSRRSLYRNSGSLWRVACSINLQDDSGGAGASVVHCRVTSHSSLSLVKSANSSDSIAV
jgi:hypothetical protein